MILGLKYNEYTPERQIRNCFIELLNGSNIDVDKLDYTIRDTKMSGISNITIDVERILKSITIITKTCFQKYCFTKNNSFANHTIHKINNKDNVGKIEIDGILKGEFVLLPNTKIKIYVGSEISSFKGEDGEAKIEYISSCVCRRQNRTDTDLEPHAAGLSTAPCRSRTALYRSLTALRTN